MTTEVDGIDPDTRHQIEALAFSGRPVIVCDVDEVALHFIGPFEAFLIAHGYELVARSYGLTGNIVDRTDHAPVGQDVVREMLFGFFDAETANQPPIDGVAEALRRLNADADIVMLTNIPGKHRQTRRDTLKRHDIPYPVVTNNGPKGPAVRLLADLSGTDIHFLDDSPSNIRSVLRHVPEANVIHFIADRRFFDLSDDLDGIDLKANDWAVASAHIARRLNMA